MVKFEICVDSIESIRNSIIAGANRVELCANLFEGGITPSIGMIRQAASLTKNTDCKLYVMIRPRGGDFCYSTDELEIMKHDIETCKKYGVDGVVFGLLLPDGIIDVENTTSLVEVAKPMDVTFHRAIDMSLDLISSLQQIMNINGVSRVLTSGGETSCLEGLDTIAKMIDIAQDNIVVMPGGGVTLKNIKTIVSVTGAKEIHVSGRIAKESKMMFKNTSCFMGGVLRQNEYQLQVADTNKISNFMKIANS